MKIVELFIENFRGIKLLDLRELTDIVVLVGTNGSGKSSVFDAIRFMKSSYGSYNPQHEELTHFFGEFQASRLDQYFHTLARDKSKPIDLRMRLELTPEEISYLKANAVPILRALVSSRANYPMPGPLANAASFLLSMRNSESLNKQVQEAFDEFVRQTEAPLVARVTMSATEHHLEPNMAISAVLSTYHPECMGVFDFHGPDRLYQREGGGDTAAGDARNERQRQHALYNYSGKYANLRAELSGAFTKELLRRVGTEQQLAAGQTAKTFKHLFSTFLPDKAFLGPKVSAAGGLTFPISSDDSTYDVNELSSGEREIVLGYVRLIDDGLSNSVIIIDEPELHLNPAITRRLPQFYAESFVAVAKNQLWLASHCESLVRSARNIDGTSIVSLQPPSGDRPQATLVGDSETLEGAIANLVGVRYRADQMVILLEGEGDEFDKEMVNRLFPDVARDVQLVCVGNKDRVLKILDRLNSIAEQSRMQAVEFRAIVDRDFEPINTSLVASWDVFHIENYLLDATHVLRVFRRLMGARCPLLTTDDVEAEMNAAATSLLDNLIVEVMERHCHDTLRSQLATSFDRGGGTAVQAAVAAVDQTKKRLLEVADGALSQDSLVSFERRRRAELAGALANGQWRVEFRGRDILKQLIQRVEKSLRYERFRNLILAEMESSGHKPDGMAATLKRIMDR
ncbi:MAG: hypothetical protein JWP97_4081 [Labilithrix sp.]|nr:hypothetical protein [Labilithrix sp.]